ncbi:MAG: FG-GAP-like repeat-containing protein [Opitutus sp.]
MFTTLRPEQTGIRSENNYSDPEIWGERYSLFSLGSTGTGVTVGDYDGDGQPDLYVVDKCGQNRLFRNLGGFRFEDVTEQAGVAVPAGPWNQAAAFADVNNDGQLDLYVSRLGAPNLLFINTGNGHFVERGGAAGVAVVDGSGMAAFCDYDRDGWLDFYLQTNLLDEKTHPAGQRDFLFHNNRDGSFTNVTNVAGIFGETHGHSATWWDYNNDGQPDLYVANDFSAPDQLYRNNGDGTFTDVAAKTLPHLPFFAMGSDLGDLNNDGLIDLFVSDMAPTTHAKDLRTMIEFRRLLPDIPSPDLSTQLVQNTLFLNTDTERCLEAAHLAGLAASDWTWSVRCEDLDNDGRLDVHVTNGMVRNFFDADLRARTADYPRAQLIQTLKASPVLAERNLVFHNRGDLKFDEVGAAWGLDHEGVSFGAAFADFDGDGDLDLVFTNYQGHPTVCRNDSQDGHRLIVALRGTNSNRFGVGATVRIETAAGSQVRQLVLARGYMSSSEPVLHFGLGTEKLITRLTVTWPTGRKQIFTDLNADRRYTITETESSTVGSEVPAAPAAGQFEEVSHQVGLDLVSAESRAPTELDTQKLLPFRQNPFGPGIAVGDLDGDGTADVVISGGAEEPALLVFNRGDGTFNGPITSAGTIGAADATPLVIEADGDGHDDLLLAKGGTFYPAGNDAYQPKLFLGRGGARFRAPPLSALPRHHVSTGPAVAADFDRDGLIDVFLGGRVVVGAYGATPSSAVWINHGGTFTDETTRWAPDLATAGMVSAALATDVDQDGWIDLLLAVHWGEVQYWHNSGGKGFENWTNKASFGTAGDGWWNSLAAGDFNGDGQMDYVAGNLGLNTPYQASPTEPALLYRGTFDSSGGPQLVEALVVEGREVPRRGRTSLAAGVPSLRQKFPTFKAYASASLPEVLGEVGLSRATRLRATNFQSGVFLSQPDGTYRFVPLPRLAQIAPIYGLVACDFDGDGNADIAAVQNSYAPISEIGRFDGGLGQFLRGDGQGNFVAVPAKESRLIVPGDGKGLVFVDLDQDGWPDLITTRNNDHALCFHNNRRTGGNSFAVELRGSKQNPHGIGSRIEVVLTDGKKLNAEVSAGGGYLSQSSPVCFFGFPDGNAPKQINVHWASGQVSSRAWASTQPVVRVDGESQ